MLILHPVHKFARKNIPLYTIVGSTDVYPFISTGKGTGRLVGW